jgi:hypothetical protein
MQCCNSARSVVRGCSGWKRIAKPNVLIRNVMRAIINHDEFLRPLSSPWTLLKVIIGLNLSTNTMAIYIIVLAK